MRMSIEVGPEQHNATKVGWMNEPDGRGTMSILVSCLSSLFLSSWAVMHLNIPQKHSSNLRQLSTYLYWCIFGIFGPELVIWTAWRQLLSAWAFRNELRNLKVASSQCTIAHGFYAVMGGFVIDLDDRNDTVKSSFTNGIQRLSLTPKGLLLLARCGHLPEVSQEEILDKSKVDELGKLLACTQVTWMIVQVCTRLALQLPITTLEVTAVSHVLCALVLYALWWHKPRKVDSPTQLVGDWVKPLAAFMLMCSRESQGQMLPGFQLEGENSEMAGLRLLPNDDSQGSDLAQPGRYKFERKPNHSNHLRNSSTHMSSEEVRTPILDGTTDGTTEERWKLALSAIEQYPAVRNLLRKPSTEHSRRYQIALANYPEMPEKCRVRAYAEEVVSTDKDWQECDTHHFVSSTASNWPHDGLLRTTSGLWIGTCLWLVSFAFSGIHVAAWHAPFPTRVEAWLWRSTSLYVAFSGLLWASIHVLASLSARVWWEWYNIMSGDASRWLKVSLGLVCGVCGLAYLFARAYLIIESFMSLRRLPVAAYIVPEWTLGVPHIA